MIKVKHPEEKCNIAQEKFLTECPPDERRFHELFYTYANIGYRYHNETRILTPTLQDWKEWLEGLPENIRNGMQAKGFEGCKTILPFTRYVMEKNDIGMDEYIKLHMGEEEYNEYKELVKSSS